MLEQLMKPVGEATTKVLVKCGSILSKEAVKQGGKIVSYCAGAVISFGLAWILRGNYDKKVFREFQKTHDKEMAQELTEQFKEEIDALKEEVARCHKDKEDAEKYFHEGIIAICKKYGLDPKVILKNEK